MSRVRVILMLSFKQSQISSYRIGLMQTETNQYNGTIDISQGCTTYQFCIESVLSIGPRKSVYPKVVYLTSFLSSSDTVYPDVVVHLLEMSGTLT